MEGGAEHLSIAAGVVLRGAELEPIKNACIHVRDGVIESIESVASGCPKGFIRVDVVTPPPANIHVHSADYAFPEIMPDRPLEDLVQPPHGVKHLMLRSLSFESAYRFIKRFYRAAERLGVGLLVDFREAQAGGCVAAKKAAEGLWFTEVVVLGRPLRPESARLPEACDGFGASSPLDYDERVFAELVRSAEISSAHVAETLRSRWNNDLERALAAGVRLLVHGTHLSIEDLKIAAQSGASLALCPRSNAWHGVGLPRLRDVVESGIVYGFGTDNAAWNPPDVMEEARFLLYVERLRGWKREDLADALLYGLYIGGYNAIGLQAPIIDEGEKAWLVGYRLDPDYANGILRARSLKYAIVKRLKMEHAALLVKGHVVGAPGKSLGAPHQPL